MKLVWSPETASKAYIDTVKSCKLFQESSVAEVVSAMAAGWNAKLVVETWSRGGNIATSIGLAVATHHSGGRHICLVPDQESRAEYIDAITGSRHMADEIIVGEPKEAMQELEGIDFLVVNCKKDNFAKIIRVAKLGQRGAVLICTNASSTATSGFSWRSMLDEKSTVVRSVYLPVGKGLGIAHVGAPGGNSARTKAKSKWIKGIDHESGEEIVIRKL